LNLLTPEWFKMDLGILRVYDKFHRNTRTHRKSEKGGTPFAAWAESILKKAEQETGSGHQLAYMGKIEKGAEKDVF